MEQLSPALRRELDASACLTQKVRVLLMEPQVIDALRNDACRRLDAA